MHILGADDDGDVDAVVVVGVYDDDGDGDVVVVVVDDDELCCRLREFAAHGDPPWNRDGRFDGKATLKGFLIIIITSIITSIILIIFSIIVIIIIMMISSSILMTLMTIRLNSPPGAQPASQC